MDIKETVQQIVREELTPFLYKAEVSIRSTNDRNITDIADELRGVCGITIVDTRATKAAGKTAQVTECNIKFFLTSPSLQQHMKRMSHVARRIKGVIRFMIKNVEKVQNG
jgi:hypothetical protein